MRSILASLLFCLPVAFIVAQDVPPQPVPDLVFPEAPQPKVMADDVIQLTPDKLYVMTSTTQYLILQSSLDGGKVTINTKDTSKEPLTFPTNVLYGKQDKEYTTFKSQFTYLIKPTTPGLVKLQCIPALPKKALTETDIKYQLINVVNTLPIPPPNPPTPDPKPVPPPAPGPVDQELVTKIKAAMQQDSASKTDIAALGKVYSDSATYLQSDTTLTTFGSVVVYITQKSIDAKVPRLPALQYVRGTINVEAGSYDNLSAFSGDLKSKMVEKYKRIGASLQEAAK